MQWLINDSSNLWVEGKIHFIVSNLHNDQDKLLQIIEKYNVISTNVVQCVQYVFQSMI